MAAVASNISVSSQGSGPVQHPYTCNTCQVAFRGSELQRTHMQSDWHRYNLKRRVASLPPLTSEVFTEKVLANQASAAALASRASFEKICGICQRTYFSENAYQNHLGSQKHKLRMAQTQSGTNSVTDEDTASMMSSTFSLGESIDTAQKAPIDDTVVQEEFSEIVDGLKHTNIEEKHIDEPSSRPTRPHHSAEDSRLEHPLSPTTSGESTADHETDAQVTEAGASDDSDDKIKKCLFCNLESADLETSVTHMRSKHGMFIPEKEYLVDLPGLIGWLWERVGTLHECLYCGQLKHTTSGIQTHMRDKGHCMIAFESEEDMVEVGQFYDFRTSYSDDEEDSEDEEEDTAATKSAKPKLGAKRTAQYVNDGDEVMEADEWEDEEEEEDGEMDVDDNASDSTERPIRATNRAYVEHFELRLPSGRTAGHRQLARYYRQNLHNYPTPAERQARLMLTEGGGDGVAAGEAAADARGRQIVTRGNGGLGLMGASDSLKKQARAKEIKHIAKQQRIESQYQWGLEKRANRQKHFRDPLLQ